MAVEGIVTRYPKAIWAPWKYDSPEGATYFKGTNKPVATVLHIMAGYAHTAVEWAAAGHYGASWHYTVSRAGEVFQHLDHSDGGYQAGIASPPAPKPTWPLWRGANGGNINNYTIGIEHEGFPGEPFTDVQATASRDLCRWLADTLGFPFARDHFPPHADIDLVNRPNDFNTPALREEHYQFLFAEEGLSVEDKARLDRLERIFAGWGFHDDDGNPLKGEAAVAYIDEHERSAYEGIRLLQIDVGKHIADKAAHNG